MEGAASALVLPEEARDPEAARAPLGSSEAASAPASVTACGADYFGVAQSTLDSVWYAWCDITQERVTLPDLVDACWLVEGADGEPFLQDGSDALGSLPLRPIRGLRKLKFWVRPWAFLE